MKKTLLIFVILFSGGAVCPPAGVGMNSGSHIFVTEQVFESDDADLLYGSIAPDLALYAPEPGSWVTGFTDTHYNFIILQPQGWTEPWKRFALGWMVHNEQWGADYPSHVEYPPGSGLPGGYVNQRAAELAPYIPVPDPIIQMEIAHNAIEFAVDVLLQEYVAPGLGAKLYDVTMNRSQRDVRRLFNILVARGKVADRETLFQSEQAFREIVLMYSQALAFSSLDDMTPLAQLGSGLAYYLYGVDIPPDQVLPLLEYSVQICAEDFDDFIFGTIDLIRDELGMD